MVRSFPAARCAATLAETVVVLALIGLLTTLVLPPLKRGYDRIQVRGAAREVMTSFFLARAAAIAQGRLVAVRVDERGARVAVVAAGDTLMLRDVGATQGVALGTTRDSMTYFPDGLGRGGANLSVILTRGSAAETVLVSREGRVKLGAKAR
ncbi:MAG TPA: GspH/FimT family protein [Gemmatimonadaceae bacterium]|nr:GspH/FimT family protein [Gemmatimonadaceae bacterium]